MYQIPFGSITENDPTNRLGTYATYTPGMQGPGIRKQLGGSHLAMLGETGITGREMRRGAYAIRRPRHNRAFHSFNGLPHGGMSETLRHMMNPAATETGEDQGFGSAWRGLIGLGKYSHEVLQKALDLEFSAVHSDIKTTWLELYQHIKGTPKIKRLLKLDPVKRSEIRQLFKNIKGARRTELFEAIFIGPQTTRGDLIGTITHERTHFFGEGVKKFDIKSSTAIYKKYISKKDVDLLYNRGIFGSQFLSGPGLFLHGYEYEDVWSEAIAYAQEYKVLRQRPNAGKQALKIFEKQFNKKQLGLFQNLELHDPRVVARKRAAKFGEKSIYISNTANKERKAILRSRQIQNDALEAMSNTENAQTRNTIPNLASSLHMDRGIRQGPRGGNG
jgi:hypothetical protein